MSLTEELQRAVIEAALEFEADRTTAKRDAFFAVTQALRQRTFYAVEQSPERVEVILYDRGNERSWAVCRPEKAVRLVQALNDRLAAGWNPGA